MYFFLWLLNKHSKGWRYKFRKIESVDPKSWWEVFHWWMYLAFSEKMAFFCKDFVKDKSDVANIIFELTKKYEYKYEILHLSQDEIYWMCANIFEVKLPNRKDWRTGILMSK